MKYFGFNDFCAKQGRHRHRNDNNDGHIVLLQKPETRRANEGVLVLVPVLARSEGAQMSIVDRLRERASATEGA